MTQGLSDMRRTQLLSSLACFLLIRCEANNSDCQMPTEDDPISICSYCSGSYAGVRWAAHSSTHYHYPYAPFVFDLTFYCTNLENVTMLSQDGCINGDLFPGLKYITPDVWRWHIVGHSLPAGAECHFTASIQDGLYKKVPELHTSCTIQDDESTVTLPVVCSSDSSGPQPQCSCQCAQGFVADAEVNHPQLLTCLNEDECSEGTHNCSNVSNCVDTDGSYYCMDDDEMTIATPDGTSSDSTTTHVTNNTTRTLPPATTHGTTVISTYTAVRTFDHVPHPRSISAGSIIGVIIAVSLVSIVVSVIIAISILRRKRCLSRDKIMTTSPQLADAFDPDFCPVNIEKFDSHSLSGMSTKTFLDPLQLQQWSADIEVLSTTNSFGSVIVLDFCDHQFTTIMHDNDYIES